MKTAFGKWLPTLMDYLLGIAVLLWCSGFFFSLSDGQNIAEERPIARKYDDGNIYTFQYDPVDERYKDNIPRNEPFHDIFAVKSLTGETERVHYAVDDHGIRTNIHSNNVKFGPKIDTSVISFGSRFTGWPSDNFNSMFLSLPQVNAQNPPPPIDDEKVVSVPSLESPPASAPLRTALSPAPPQQLNMNPDINENIQSPKELSSSDFPVPDQRLYAAELGYEPQRISKPFLPNPTYPTDNLPTSDYRIFDKEPHSALQNPVHFKTESEAIAKGSDYLPSQPEFAPQLSNLNYIQHQFANNKNLKWYQSLPQVPPAMHSMYSAPFYPADKKYESQRNAKQSQSGSTSLKESLKYEPIPTDVPNVNFQTAVSPKFKESDMVRETEAIKSFPNKKEFAGHQTTSSSPEKTQDSINFPVSQNQKTNIQQYVGTLKLSRPQGVFQGTIVSQPQNVEKNLNNNKYIEYQKTSSFPLKNLDSASVFEAQKEEVNSNFNQYIGSQKPSNTPEQFLSTIPIESQKQLINTNQYAVDSKYVSQSKSQDSLSNVDQSAGSQKAIYQSFKQQNTFSNVNKGIVPSFPKTFPKNILPSTKQRIVSTPTQNKERMVVNSKLSPLFRKNAPFVHSKSLVSSPMSTIFDTSNENGQYYHYVMNVGKKSGNNVPARTMISTVNLFKLLNDTGIRKLSDNKKINGKVMNLDDSKTINETEKVNLMFQKLERNTNKEFGSSLKSDLDVSGDVIDATEIFQDLPEINVPDKALEEKGDKQVLVKVIDEITNIINTEEPHSSTQTTNQGLRLMITTQPTTEQTTSSFLEDLFEINTMPTELPTEYIIRDSTKSVSGDKNADQNTESPSLFITKPENSLISLFYDDDIDGNPVNLLKENPSDESSLFDRGTSSESSSEIKAATESRNSKESTPTTAISFETSTIRKSPVTITESSTFVSTSSEATSTESLSSDTNKDFKDVMFSTTTTKLIPTVLASTTSPDVSKLFTETLNEMSENNTEEPSSTVPTSSILVDVVNSDTNQDIADLTDAPTSNTEQPKPMLELVIQNSEMNDFMSRINNMPIMIRVLNPLTTTTQSPDVGREISTTKESFNTILSTSLNDMVDVSSTEATTLTSTTMDSREIYVTGVSEEKAPASLVQALPPTQSNTNAFAVETLISEPNLEDTVILTSLNPQNSESTLSDITDTETERFSNITTSSTTPIPKSRETNTADSQPPETLQYTLITHRPGNSEISNSPLLSTLEFESFSDYANKLASSAQNYNIEGPIEVHEDQRSELAVSGESYTAMPLTNADEPLIHMFIDSDQVHASEESQKIPNFKSMNNNRELKQSAIRPVNVHSPSQPIIIKNSTVIQYQGISNYKGYDHHAPVQYVDFVPFKDIDYDSHVPLGTEDKFPLDTIYVLDDYDVLPPNPDGQNNEYVFIGNNGNFESNILPPNVLPPTDFDAQHVYIIDSNTPKFGARFQQETSKDEYKQEKQTDVQQPVPLNFENFRPQRSFESKSDLRKEPWFPSQ